MLFTCQDFIRGDNYMLISLAIETNAAGVDDTLNKDHLTIHTVGVKLRCQSVENKHTVRDGKRLSELTFFRLFLVGS